MSIFQAGLYNVRPISFHDAGPPKDTSTRFTGLGLDGARKILHQICMPPAAWCAHGVRRRGESAGRRRFLSVSGRVPHPRPYTCRSIKVEFMSCWSKRRQRSKRSEKSWVYELLVQAQCSVPSRQRSKSAIFFWGKTAGRPRSNQRLKLKFFHSLRHINFYTHT
jgi:hypothetical protein